MEYVRTRLLGLRSILMIVGLGFGFFSSRFDIFGGYETVRSFCLHTTSHSLFYKEL